MSESPHKLTAPLVEILELHEDYKYQELFRLLRARLRYRRFDGEMSEPVTRLTFERGDSVAVLLYDRKADAVILARQFRYPVYAGLSPDEQGGEPAAQAWLLETVAGVQDAGQAAADVARKELFEEVGYRVAGDLRPIATFYVSPGSTSERITLFWAEVEGGPETGAGGGVVAEGENIQMVALPRVEAMQMIADGAIRDAKTIIALQHLALLQGRAPEQP